jgi:predicted nucleotidyltransferase
MARGNFREYLKGDSVWVKKYFYVLRPVLACIWIERGFGIVPTEFEILVDGIVHDKELKEAIDMLLAKKKAGNELDMGERIDVISDFLDSQIGRLSTANEPPAASGGYENLDRLFIEALKETNGASI